MGWKKIIILTYKPAVEDSWKNELAEHSDFSGWDFFKASDIPENSDNPIVAFSSFQDLL